MLGHIIQFLLMPFFWIPAIGILSFLTYRNYKKINRLKVLNVDSVLLMLEIPRTNDKKELAAEQMFASLHGLLKSFQLADKSASTFGPLRSSKVLSRAKSTLNTPQSKFTS